MARDAASRHGLDPPLVCAIVEQESSWDTWAIRYEPAFYERYVVPLISSCRLSATEAHARATSWGLMQVMGQVAREHKFCSEFLSSLCDPDNGLDLGCRVFAARMIEAGGSVQLALQLWNGGAAPDYASQVLARVSRFQTEGGRSDL